MFFWPKKIIALLFLPLQFALLTGTLGLILLHLRRREKLARLLLTASIAALALFSNKGVSQLLMRPLESRFAPLPEFLIVPSEATGSPNPESKIENSSLTACRYVVVLGGGHARSPGLSRINQLSTASLSRLAEAIRLFRQLPPDTLLVVSGHDGDENISHAQVLAEAAISLGVPADRIVRFDQTRDTHDEALALRQLAGDTPVALVTSAWHMPRSMKLCEKAGLRAIACPADLSLKPEPDTVTRFLRFELPALERSTKAIREYLGLTWTALRGQT